MKKRGWIILGIVFVLAIAVAATAFFVFDGFSKPGDFSKTSLIRMNIPLGGEINTAVKITNYDKNPQTIKFHLNNFKDLASLSENEFSLQPKESKELVISFSDKKNEAGVYVGKLIIENSFSMEEIPIVLGVEDPNRAFAIIQTGVPKYDNVYPGGKLGLDFKVFDLINSNVQTVSSHYVVKNLDDETILNGNTDLVVGTGSKTELVNIPKGWALGDYVFISYIEYDDTLSFSSYLFSVTSPQKEGMLSDSNLFLVGVVVLVVLVLVMVLYFVKTRDSLLINLKKQQEAEIKRNLNYLKCSRETIRKSKSKAEDKRVKLKKLKIVEKKIIGKIKQRQKVQKNELKKLHKKKVKKDVLHEKLNKWKAEGYKMYEADGEVKKIMSKGIKDQVKDWKNQGYDTSFLNK